MALSEQPIRNTREYRVIAATRNEARDIFQTRVYRRLFLAFVLAMSFQTFRYFPGMQYVQETWFVICFIGLVLVYPFVKIFLVWGVTRFEVYLLTLMPLNVFLPALTSAREFGQPLLYGILAQRAAILITAALLLFTALRSKVLTFRDIEAVLLWLAWGTSVLYLFMTFFLNPANFTSYGSAFASSQGIVPRFVLHAEFPSFALVYYAFLGLRRRRAKYYIAAVYFLIAILTVADARSYTVSFACTFIYYLFRLRPMGKVILTIGKVGLAAVIAVVCFYAINPEYASSRLGGFSDAFKVVFRGQEVDDPSANIRLLEVATAWPYILKNPLLGTGQLSNQWRGGNGEMIDRNFVPGDIGMIGAVYSFGLVGLSVFAYQFKFAIRATNRLSDQLRSPLADACIGLLLLNAIYSMTASLFAFYPETTLFFIAVLVALPKKKVGETSQLIRLEPSVH
jgi:hypothetical protein